MGNSWLELSTIGQVYGELSGQRIELEPNLPQLHFTVRQQTPLTTAEALHALDLLLGWDGLEVVKNKDGGLKLTRVEK
jgi:hypothetical protein